MVASTSVNGPHGHGELLAGYLEECRTLVLEEIRALIPPGSQHAPALYELMMDYPLREAKGLRPALCIATCRALGGTLEAALRPAAVLELYHNAFLIHDDIEDESLLRRGLPTLHRAHGVPVAVNVGDAMFALTLQPLLDNIAIIGLGPSLRILQAVARMTRESVEGQALELDWIRRGTWQLEDQDYLRMAEQKTCWYSFITPVRLGAISARLDAERTHRLAAFARGLGLAFQIQDDILNLCGDVGAYGKEIGGDLWEGKRTLILLHMMRNVSGPERAEAEYILSLPRPSPERSPDRTAAVESLLEQLVTDGDLTPSARKRLQELLAATPPHRAEKTPEQVRFLLALIERHGSIEHARHVAQQWLRDAERTLAACLEWVPASIHRSFLEGLLSYVLQRVK